MAKMTPTTHRIPFSSALLACVLVAGCGTEAKLVQDVTKESGIDFRHAPSDQERTYFMPYSVGSGAALFDFDNDGRLDIYLLQIGGPDSGVTNRLYHQQPSR